MIMWEFKTRHFTIRAEAIHDPGYVYDGDDENGETQAALNSGEYVAFDTMVSVYYGTQLIGRDFLGGSVYCEGRENDFFSDHRDADPLNRNCSLMRAARGENVSICHYFPDMVREAVREARKTMRELRGVHMRRAA